jgi:hypothetical protein
MTSWPELHQRLLDLAQTLQGHGIEWEPFGSPGATVWRGSRVPPEVVAEMKGLLEDLRAILPAMTTETDVWWFADGCRRLAKAYPEKSADFEALAERAEREQATFVEERERLHAAVAEKPEWGPIQFLEPGKPRPFEYQGPSLPAGVTPRRDYPAAPPEPTAASGFKALCRLLMAWEAGALEGRKEE